MSKAKFLHLLTYVVFFLSLTLNSQTQKESKQPLTVVLTQLENTYNISFSYADANLKNVRVKTPKLVTSLKSLIEFIEQQTGLIFEQLNAKTYVIRQLKASQFFKTQLLDEILITNYLTEGISVLDNGVTTIKPKDFGILPGLIEPDVLQTILALPGVQSVDERISNLNIRGGTHDQNLILWDGIKMYQSGHFFGLISAFNPYLTQEIRVAKNGTSAMYGDGVSGIIDMSSSQTISDESEYGIGFNMISADTYAKIPFNTKTELQISARRSLTDLIETPTYSEYSKRIFQDTDLTNSNTVDLNEKFYFYDTSSKLTYDISKKDKITFNSLIIFNDLNYNENTNNETLQSNLTQQNLAFGLQYNRIWNSKLETFAQFYMSKYNLEATNFDTTNDQRLFQENEVIDAGLKLHAKYKLDSTLAYFGGYQFSEVGIGNLEDVLNPDYRKYVKEVLRTHAIFNEIKFVSKSKNTSARIGVRSNYIEKFSELYFEPRLSFSQKFLSNFRFEILGELKSQTTSQIIDLQNDFLGIEKRRWVLSNNSNIPIIKSKQLSTGLEYNNTGLTISAEAYYKSVEGITTRSQGFQNQYQFVNAIGQYDVKGLDVLVNKKFNHFSTWLSYSFSDNNYLFKDLNFGEKFPNNSHILHAFTFASAYNYNNFKISVGFNYKTGRPFTLPDAQNPLSANSINYGLPNSDNLDDYFRTDLSANFKFTIGKAKAETGLSLWNVLNQKNTINTYFFKEGNTISKVENKSLGITPNASFRLIF